MPRGPVSTLSNLGIVGIGGLSHVAVEIAKDLGARPVAITTSPVKADDAGRLGADESILSTNAMAMKKHLNSFDFILNWKDALP